MNFVPSPAGTGTQYPLKPINSTTPTTHTPGSGVPTKVTTTYKGTTTYKACIHDGDKELWSYKDASFVIADKIGCCASVLPESKHKPDVVLDLNQNLAEKFVIGGPDRFVSLNEKMHGDVEIVQIKWTDYGIPNASLRFWEAMLEELASKECIVMISCHGGHGRSGTALASLMVASGMNGYQAIKLVRKVHCEKAVENKKQEDYVLDLRGDTWGEADDDEIKKALAELDAQEKEAFTVKDFTVDGDDDDLKPSWATAGDDEGKVDGFGNPLFSYCIYCTRDFEVPSATSDTCSDCYYGTNGFKRHGPDNAVAGGREDDEPTIAEMMMWGD